MMETIISCWLLVVGCWLLVVGCQFFVIPAGNLPNILFQDVSYSYWVFTFNFSLTNLAFLIASSAVAAVIVTWPIFLNGEVNALP